MVMNLLVTQLQQDAKGPDRKHRSMEVCVEHCAKILHKIESLDKVADGAGRFIQRHEEHDRQWLHVSGVGLDHSQRPQPPP